MANNTVYKYMSSISKMFILIDLVKSLKKKYSNTHHRTVTFKPANMKLKTYFNFNKDNNYKFKVGDYSIMSKYKNIFAEGYVPD